MSKPTTAKDRERWLVLLRRQETFRLDARHTRRLILDLETALKALESAEVVYQHRHFCEECLPARGCHQFYVLHSQAAAHRAALGDLEVHSE